MTTSIFNPELIKIARHNVTKAGFVDAATATGGGGATDPMAQAMPPMPGMGGDPAAGGDPMAAAGGVDPMADPMAAGGEAAPVGVTKEEVQQIIQEAMAGAGGAGAGPGGEKMKVDVNTEIYHIKSLLTRLTSELGIKVDPQMLKGDPAMDPAVPQEQAAQDPNSAAAQQSAISPIEGIQGASPAMAGGGGGGGGGGGVEMPKAASWVENGHSFDSSNLLHNTDRASALARQLRGAVRPMAHAG